ncbi:MAG: LA_2272 family surface repeat-containing protein [Hyphomicrobiales bacterium]
MSRTLPFLALLAIVAVAPESARAASSSPIQVALWNPVQIVKETDSVGGVRLSILYGVNQDMTGFDVGLVNSTKGVFKGYQHSLVSITEGKFYGVGANFVSIARDEMRGVQWGFYNQAKDAHGLMAGFINSSESMDGVQLALLNMTQNLHGLQVGLVNVASKNPSHPVLPIVNWKF